MTVTAMRRLSFPAAGQAAETSRAGGRGRWRALADLLGGAFLVLVWIALWTITWAAVAGPLSPVAQRAAFAPAATAGAETSSLEGRRAP